MGACYIVRNSQILLAKEGVPCTDGTGVRQCCGRNHVCGAQGFCHFTQQSVGTVSGYYLGGCTDATFTDSACPQQCTDRAFQDVVYNNASDQWSCCAQNTTIDCTNPSDESFSAPDAAELFASNSTTTISTTPSVSATPAPSTAFSTSTSTSTTNAATSGASKPGATVPASTIAVATIIPILAISIMIGLAWWWYKRKRDAHAKTSPWADQHAELMSESWTDDKKSTTAGSSLQELGSEPRRFEMPTPASMSELGGRPMSQYPSELGSV